MSEVLEKAAPSPVKSAKSLLEQGKSAENQSGEGCANTPSPWQSTDTEGLEMLAANLPDETIPRKRGERLLPRVAYTADELEFVRTASLTMTDRQIADAMGWTIVKVKGVRRTNKIPSGQVSPWTPEKVAQLHDLYIVQGVSSGVVGPMLGCSAAAVRIKAAKMNWVHDPKHANRNRGISVRASAAARRGRVRRAAAVTPPPAHCPLALVASSTVTPSILFAAAATEGETLGDRILRELSAKPLSTCSLATLLGEKELLVSMQLSAFAHQGLVEAGPVGERGLRHRVWSSLAESAASLRCGPDSSVVAGEAA